MDGSVESIELPGEPIPTVFSGPFPVTARLFGPAHGPVPAGWRPVWEDQSARVIVPDDGTPPALDPEVMPPEAPPGPREPAAEDEPFLQADQRPSPRRLRGPVGRYKEALERPADGAESKALSILLVATKAALGTLIEGMDEKNASRTLAQVGQVTEAQRSALQILGAHVNPEDFGRWNRRHGKYGGGGLQLSSYMDRETMGVSALGQIVAAWQASEKPKSLAALLEASASAKAIGDETLSKDLAEQGRKLAEEIKNGPSIEDIGKNAMGAMKRAADMSEGMDVGDDEDMEGPVVMSGGLVSGM